MRKRFRLALVALLVSQLAMEPFAIGRGFRWRCCRVTSSPCCSYNPCSTPCLPNPAVVTTCPPATRATTSDTLPSPADRDEQRDTEPAETPSPAPSPAPSRSAPAGDRYEGSGSRYPQQSSPPARTPEADSSANKPVVGDQGAQDSVPSAGAQQEETFSRQPAENRSQETRPSAPTGAQQASPLQQKSAAPPVEDLFSEQPQTTPTPETQTEPRAAPSAEAEDSAEAVTLDDLLGQDSGAEGAEAPAEGAEQSESEEADDTPDLDNLFNAVPADEPLKSAGGLQSTAMRLWTDRSGNHQCEARLVRVTTRAVVLQNAGSEQLEVPLVRLSDADLQFVHQQVVAYRAVKGSASGVYAVAWSQ